MILKDTILDKMLSVYFPESVIDNIKYGTIGYLGINISENPDTDIDFKIYYDSKYCIDNFREKINCKLLDVFFNHFKIDFFEIVLDKKNVDLSRYNIKLVLRKNDYMNKMFDFLSDNVQFFNKYKNEIINQSAMQITCKPESKYASLFILGFVKENNDVKKIKCYWLTKHREMLKEDSDKYFLEFFEKQGVEKIKQLLPLVKKLLINCKANLWMQGIDYNPISAEKHKIYLDSPQNLYNGLEVTFSDCEILKQRILLLKDWHENHPEFYCEGFALGMDERSNLTLNMYYKLKISKFNDIMLRLSKKKKLI